MAYKGVAYSRTAKLMEKLSGLCDWHNRDAVFDLLKRELDNYRANDERTGWDDAKEDDYY